ncbi:right-handed parallel beta-helix repeat-containing protein [Flavihumibacter fluvii]|uniref:right-handed parallel beta-helix repeat-containing protein n=1 Tax=Flavihumibacter fluvii TaxID=2838157 RepID=UPI001BDEACE8|nr:right-handed parallel beta-helix repeat-containing protein [Flavihumibacter fluvii]ULQ51412.1 right-handed parallel beta-helix repeat-containing protein [Flavihumibacter fluvii]
MLNKYLIVLFLFVQSLAFLIPVTGQTIYVSPAGKDKNPGTKDKPVASFAKAQILARQFPAGRPVEVVFSKGVYYLPEAIRFTSKDSKASTATVTYRAEEEGQAILSGGSKLALQWKQTRYGLYTATIPANTVIDQLYINGERQRMARFPNAVTGKNVFDTWSLDHAAKADSSLDPLSPERIARWKNPAGGFIHTMHEYLWGDMHWAIKGKNADGTLLYEGGWQNNRPSNMHPLYRMVENIFEELDVPGEWFYNAMEHQLYYMPQPGTDLTTATVEIVRLRHLIEFNGSKENPVTAVNLQGFVFRHTARSFMDNKEPLLRSDWTVYRGGAVVFNGAADCHIKDCEFDQVGGNAIFINNYNRRISISGCYIHHSGANGIAFVGDPATVRSPLFQYGNQDYKNIDRIPGPKGDNYPEDCTVEDCLITMTGRDEKQTAPVHISMSHKIRVSHCSIYDVPRAGININEGTFGGHIIEDCDVFNTVLETGDHGSFNSWGRDRYWTPDVNETSAMVDKHPDMPSWDMLEPNIIRNSRWRCDHGWDIDLDDGSSYYQIYNNLLLNGGLKMREGYHRTASNNVIINNGLHPHVWYTGSGDVFTRNIVFKAYQPAIMDKVIAPDGKWGRELDRNFYVSGKDQLTAFAKNNCDLHSLNGDPNFEAAAKGDFRVKTGSPALDLGFNNFPMDDFGVRKPALKAKAKTPEIPVLQFSFDDKKEAHMKPAYTWMDVVLHEPTGAEMSGYGVSFDAGGIALPNVPENSRALQHGFKNGDLIQDINGVAIKKIADLQNYVHSNQVHQQHLITLIRNQSPVKLTVTGPVAMIVPVGVPSVWMGFDRIDFEIAGRNCLLVAPKRAAKNNPWIWRTEFFGHEPQGDSMLLANGYHVAYMDVFNMYGAPVGLDLMDKFYAFLTSEKQLNKKVVLEGFSRGGLFAFNWAARNPSQVACIYVDAPVLDFKSWPGGKYAGKGSPNDWQQLLQVYGLTEQQAMVYKLNPVDNLKPIAKAKIPILSVCGDADKTVPMAENTSIAEKRYKKLGGKMKVIAKPGVDHHPHSLQDPTPIIQFILENTLAK